MSALRLRLFLPVLLALVASTSCMSKFSTDIPVNFQTILEDKYVGRTAWTRATLEDEKRPVRIEQDQEVKIVDLGMQRTGSVTLVAATGRTRVVFPFRLQRPLTLEDFEKTLLDYLWMESPQVRFDANKQKYGTRIAEAIRDHKILKDMPLYVAYLSWGAPSGMEKVQGTAIDRWVYDRHPNVKGRVDFLAAKVAKFEGENVQDTEAAKKKKSIRRGSTATASAEKK